MPIKTDFHTHLLPDVDCSGDLDSAVALVNNMKAAGIERIVMTPHFYPHRHSNVDEFIAKRNAKIARLTKALDDNGIGGIEFFPAAEILLCPALDKLEGLGKLCISGTKTLLIEMPDLPWSESLYEALTDIRDLGYTVVIAHADRYGKKESETLIAKGFYVQLNADSLCTLSGKLAFTGWIKSGYVYALGSDKHVHSDKHTPIYKDFPKASSAVEKCAVDVEGRMLELIGK